MTVSCQKQIKNVSSSNRQQVTIKTKQQRREEQNYIRSDVLIIISSNI